VIAGGASCEVLRPTDDRWADVLAGLPHDFYHLPSYCDLNARRVEGEALAVHVKAGSNQFFLPLVVQPQPPKYAARSEAWRDASSPYGYSGPIVVVEQASEAAAFCRSALAALLETLRELRVVTAFVRFHPLIETPLAPFEAAGALVRHGRTVSVELRASPDQLWRQMRRNHRMDIRRLRESGRAVFEHDTTWRNFDAYLSAYQETADRVGAHKSYYFERSYYERLRSILGDTIHLCAVHIDGEMAAAGIFIEHGKVVHYHLSATRNAYLDQRPNKLLCHEASLWARERGNHVLHLGGGVGGREDSLYHFKAGFSEARHPFHTWRACTDAEIYQDIVRTWRADETRGPIDPQYFPLYRQFD
jgi:CelD/BcsL family acetyltransferase involved in cellulose biosynthesis